MALPLEMLVFRSLLPIDSRDLRELAEPEFPLGVLEPLLRRDDFRAVLLELPPDFEAPSLRRLRLSALSCREEEE